MASDAIIGAGVTGLAVGMVSGAPVFEQAGGPGGICSSYYLRRGDPTVHHHPPPADDAYRFEIGGGHWIFGGAPEVLERIEGLAPTRTYQRRASVRIGATTVPYPLQEHVDQLGPDLARRVTEDRQAPPTDLPDDPTLRQWLRASFGPTLDELFFAPFNDRYTAGLAGTVAAQDAYKSPVPATARPTGSSSGYNAEFRYPAGGLDALVGAMADRCDVRYSRTVTAIDTPRGELRFADGGSVAYDRLVSTLPLQVAVSLAGVKVDEPPDPHTSVLVLNIGAERGPRSPDTHWQYEPDAGAGFHRLGWYSNVDRSFLPAAHRATGDRVGLYVERAYLGGDPPSPGQRDAYRDETVAELQDRGYIGEVEVLDPSWVEVAYTWRRPGSTWRRQALSALGEVGVKQVGRYGIWRFQGIADSVADGLQVGEWLAAPTGRR